MLGKHWLRFRTIRKKPYRWGSRDALETRFDCR